MFDEAYKKLDNVPKKDFGSWFVSFADSGDLFALFREFEQIFEKPHRTAQERNMLVRFYGGPIAGCFGTPRGCEIVHFSACVMKEIEKLKIENPTIYAQKEARINGLLEKIRALK